MAPSEADLEQEEEPEPGPSGWGGMNPQERPESLGPEENVVLCLSGMGGRGAVDWMVSSLP